MTWLSRPFPPICPAPALIEPLTVYALPGQPNTWLLTLTRADQGALSWGGIQGTVYPVIRQNGQLHVSLHTDRFVLMDEDGNLETELLEQLRRTEPHFQPSEERFQADHDGPNPPNECAWLLPNTEKPEVAVLKTETIEWWEDGAALYEVMLNLPGSKKVRGMLREFPLYDESTETMGWGLWVRLADGSPALLHNAHTDFFDNHVHQRLLYDTPPLAVPGGKREAVQEDQDLAPAEDLPSLLFLTQMVSKYAKVPPDGIDRRALYRVKDAMMQILYTQGMIVPDVLLTAEWEFASNLGGWGPVLADSLADEMKAYEDDMRSETGEPGVHPWGPVAPTVEAAQAWLDSLVKEAERSGEAIPTTVFEERGVLMVDLPVHHGWDQSDWRDLSERQLEQLHPRASCLIGFGTPDDPGSETLHIPYLDAACWLTTMPERTAVRKAERYGEPPTPEQEQTWPLERVLRQLGYDLSHDRFKRKRLR